MEKVNLIFLTAWQKKNVCRNLLLRNFIHLDLFEYCCFRIFRFRFCVGHLNDVTFQLTGHTFSTCSIERESWRFLAFIFRDCLSEQPRNTYLIIVTNFRRKEINDWWNGLFITRENLVKATTNPYAITQPWSARKTGLSSLVEN